MTVTVRMPDAEELMRRLKNVNREAHFVKYVYPFVCSTLGGWPKGGEEVMTTLGSSIIESASIFRMEDQLHEMMRGLQKFADELLVDDLEPLRPGALAFLGRLYARTG